MVNKLKKNKRHVVILAGGKGCRLSPLSTDHKPKQFINLLQAHKSMLQETWCRVSPLVTSTKEIWVTTLKNYGTLVREQLPLLPRSRLILEPLAKSTAASVAWVVKTIFRRDPNAQILFIPADHYIHQIERAQEIWDRAFQCCDNERVLLFGVQPRWPSPHYGYILNNAEINPDGTFSTIKFIEKPQESMAAELISKYRAFWNSGIFLASAHTWFNSLQSLLPEVTLNDTNDIMDSNDKLSFFELFPHVSIDKLLLEKNWPRCMLPFDVGWSDVGTWDGLNEIQNLYNITLPDEVQSHLKLYQNNSAFL